MSFPPPHSTIHLPAPLTPRPDIRLIIFDFDGTLSWLRHGWPGMMADVAEPHFPAAANLHHELLGEILALNGQPSIRQCERFAQMLAERGLSGHDPETFRAEFQRRLDDAIDERIARIKSGATSAENYVIHGLHAFLEHASKTGIELGILSTTIQHRVEEEAQLLGIAKYFGKHVYGGTGDPKLFSKRAIFERILREEGVPGAQLLSFGDGPVELRDTKQLGGLAVGVCSDEDHNGSGLADPHKRAGLLAAGADAVIPDYRDAAPLVDYILGR